MSGSFPEPSIVVAPSQARTTAPPISGPHPNLGERGVEVVVNITAAAGGSITVHIRRRDAAGVVTTYLSSLALTLVGATRLRVHPELVDAANATAKDVVSEGWYVEVVANNASSLTYSVTAFRLN